MSLWMLIVLLGLIKLPIAALMLWIPFRDDAAISAPEPPRLSPTTTAARARCPRGPLDPRTRARCRPPAPAAARPARRAASPLPTARSHGRARHARGRASRTSAPRGSASRAER